LPGVAARRQDAVVFRRGRPPPLEPVLVRDLVVMVMRMDAKLDRILRLLGEENGEEEGDA
jgi:hypothetical protein